MKFKIVEEFDSGLYNKSTIDTLNETLYRDIINQLEIKTKGRGDTTLRIFICNILGLNPDDYDIHHINGHHDDYSLENIALVPRDSKANNSIHKTVSKIINKSSEARELYNRAVQGDQASEAKLSEILYNNFRTILANTPGHIIVIDEFKKRGMKV